MKDVAEWLASLDLGEYAQRFAENAIDLSAIRDLTENDLKEIGVLLGHRRKMLRAIAELQRAPASTLQMATEPGRDHAERRQLTVMFCDLVGSTALAARLDPEDMRQVMALFHRRIAEVIGGYEGVVARYMGDGVLAYFGYPQAHEDDAVQAVSAGLALVETVADLRTGGNSPLQIRIGIATGGSQWWETSSARAGDRTAVTPLAER
jgi:class 3 adenylate cyclase